MHGLVFHIILINVNRWAWLCSCCCKLALLTRPISYMLTETLAYPSLRSQKFPYSWPISVRTLTKHTILVVGFTKTTKAYFLQERINGFAIAWCFWQECGPSLHSSYLCFSASKPPYVAPVLSWLLPKNRPAEAYWYISKYPKRPCKDPRGIYYSTGVSSHLNLRLACQLPNIHLEYQYY